MSSASVHTTSPQASPAQRISQAEEYRRQKMTKDGLKRLRLKRARLYYRYHAATKREEGEAIRAELLSEKMALGPDEKCHTCGGNYYQARWIETDRGRWAVTEIEDHTCKYCREHPGHEFKAIYE